MAQITRVNPWQWQDPFAFSQAIEVREGHRVLYCAGQASVDAHGNVLHAGDLHAQLQQALDNLETVLAKAGLSLANVVRLNYYTTNIQGFLAAVPALAERLRAAGIQPAGTLLGVASLFHPDALIEIETTAVS